jgi:phospholipase C
MTEEEITPVQTPLSRRRLLGAGAALAGGSLLAAYLPTNVRRAMAASDPTAAFDPSQVKHIVLLMQENRSFDHYFGTLSGVRGFSDPTAKKLASGRSVFQQPDPDNPDAYLMPYHLDSTTSSAQYVPSLSHAWQVQHESWNNGNMDGWLRAHIASDSAASGPFTMGYYNSTDIPFQYALANAFTICDNYFCSVLGPTHPNRYMWMTGTVDPTGANGGPALDNNATPGTYTWTTTAERLQDAGISWKCYQQADNYGTNILENFGQLLAAKTASDAAQPSSLYRRAFDVSTLLDGSAASDPTMAFEEDCANGTLPAVSWIFPTSTASEHPKYLPAAGAQFVASKINALAANEDLWSSTVFILDYDENDGYFDHVAPPSPPKGTADEFVSLNSPGGTPGGGLPVGGGFRVPCIVISPWTVGGYVCSEPFDHTSVLQFVETVTGITETNISAWRRQTFGDLTSAFQTTASAAPSIPAGSAAATQTELTYQQGQASLPLPKVPGRTQAAPTQDPGTRPPLG